MNCNIIEFCLKTVLNHQMFFFVIKIFAAVNFYLSDSIIT